MFRILTYQFRCLWFSQSNLKRIVLVILVLSTYFSIIIIIVETNRVQFTIWDWRCGGASRMLNLKSEIRGSEGSSPKSRVLRGNAPKPKQIYISGMTPDMYFPNKNLLITLWWYRHRLYTLSFLAPILAATDFNHFSSLYKWNINVLGKGLIIQIYEIDN